MSISRSAKRGIITAIRIQHVIHKQFELEICNKEVRYYEARLRRTS